MERKDGVWQESDRSHGVLWKCSKCGCLNSPEDNVCDCSDAFGDSI